MNLKRVGYVSVILTGYVSISFGILKIFWRQHGVHFYASEVEHAPQAGMALDFLLISLIILSGMCLVVVRMVIPALICLVALFLYEVAFLHAGPHDLWQTALFVAAIGGQLSTLAICLVEYPLIDRPFFGKRLRHR